jgi:hypothetical protein
MTKNYRYKSGPKKNMSIEDRFWEKVDIGESDECWNWKGAALVTGYGEFYLDRKPVRANRLAWELTYGPIPDGLFACHKCDNRLCCNPDHMFIGTPLDNAKDMIDKGRDRHSSVLSKEDVVEIRRKRIELGIPCKELAKEYHVGTRHIRFVVSGKVKSVRKESK